MITTKQTSQFKSQAVNTTQHNKNIYKRVNVQTIMDLSVVIPTINSSKIIKENVLKIRKTIEDIIKTAKIDKFEILIAAQTSTDNTFEILNTIKDDIIKPVFIKPKGKGIGLTLGIRKAKYDWVLMVDDDIPYDITKFLKLAIEKYVKEAEIIIASRYVSGGKYQSSMKRKVLSWTYRLIIKIIFGIPQKDIQAGMKIIKRNVFKKIKYPKEHGYIWDTELLYNANKKNIKIVEIPVILENPENNQLKIIKAAINMLLDMIKLRLSI